MKNIKKEQIKNLFNNFIDIIKDGIWFSGIEGYGKYKGWWNSEQLWIDVNYNKNGLLMGKYREWYENGNLIFEIEFENNKLISINYIDFDYNKDWFKYYDQI